MQHYLHDSDEEIPLNIQNAPTIKSYGFELSIKLPILFILSISLAAMGSFIFLEASTFPCEQYLLTQMYIVCFAGMYLVTYACLTRSEFFTYLRQFEFRHIAFIGIAWATNYTFILLSASHLTNSLQVIIAQSQSALIALVDYKFVGIHLTRFKVLCIAANIIGNLIAIGSAGFTGGIGMVFWCFIFLINALASGLANLYSEVYMKRKLDADANLADRFKMVVAINMTSNMVGIAITFLGLPLARYSVGPDVPLYDFTIFSDTRIWYWVGMLVMSFVYTNCAYLMLHSESSIFNAMCSGIGAFLQLCFFMTPIAPYNEIPPAIVIVSAVVVIVSSLLYTSRQELRNEDAMRSSFFGRAADSGDLNGALGLMYFIASVLYLMVDTIIPLLPTLSNCIDIYSVA